MKQKYEIVEILFFLGQTITWIAECEGSEKSKVKTVR